MVAVGSLADVFGAAAVRRLAGPVVYGRGSAYFSDGRVDTADVRDGRLAATVRGTMPYLVELWADRGGPRWSCTCPAAEDGSFCKHAVAAALSLGASDDGLAPAPPAASGRPAGQASGRCSESDTEDELAAFVGGLPPERLAEIVLERAASDWRLRERLLAYARAARGAGPDVAEWRRRIDRAFGPGAHVRHGFVTYGDAPGWAAGIDEVIDALEDLCDAGHHDAAARLAEHAHRRADASMGYVDDSDGWLSGISERLSELHFQACEAGRPDPAELAGRLVDLEMTSELEGFYRSAAVYAEILGEAGLADFRMRLEPHLDTAAGQTDEWSSEKYRVRHAMAGWALGTGDPEALIEAHTRARDRMLPGDVLEIAQALDRAGRGDEAVAWARRGMSDPGSRGWHAGELRDFLARKLRDRGEGQAAVALFWEAFVEGPSLPAYRRLLDEGVGEDWLARCRSELRNALARVPGGTGPRGLSTPAVAFGPMPPAVPGAAAALVEILLFEGLVDDAWDVANDHGCRAQMWMTLARAREESHPLDAIAVYEPAALAIIDRKKADRYQSAVDLLVRIRRLADSAGKPRRFASLLERVRTEHKAKRKLKALLDDQGW